MCRFCKYNNSHSDEFSESWGVVVPDCLGIAIRLEDWVGVDDPVLQVGLLLRWRLAVLLLLALRGSEDGKVGDDLFGVLRFSGPRLTGDLEKDLYQKAKMIIFKRTTHQHRLILGVVHHLGVGAVTSSEQVRRHLNNFCKLMMHMSCCCRCLPRFSSSRGTSDTSSPCRWGTACKGWSPRRRGRSKSEI